MSPEVRARLNAPTTKRASIKYVPLTKKEVRDAVPASERPRRAIGGKPKRVSNTQITEDLNKLEKQLNAYGYSLRDNATVVYREHKPNRALLEKQEQKARAVARAKPKRAPLSKSQLRDNVRRAVKAPRRPSARAGAGVNQFWTMQSPAQSAAVSFDWQPMLGEPELAAAFMDTRANFSGRASGSDLDLDGNIVVRAGAYILDERYDAFRLDAEFSRRGGVNAVDVIVTKADGYEQPLTSIQQSKSVSINQNVPLHEYEPPLYSTTLLIAGIPVDIELSATTSVSLDYSAELTDAVLMGYVQPEVSLGLTLEAYVDAWLAEVGVGGEVELLNVRPELVGATFLGEEDGQTEINSVISGWVRTSFLSGRAYFFLELGWWIFTTRFEWELFDYEGWSWDVPVWNWDSSAEP